MDSAERQKQIAEMFAAISGWEARYRKIIELGSKLESLPEELKTEDVKVKGCQSQVWLRAELKDGGLLNFRADSDALIVKGLIAILLAVYNGLTPAEILKTEPSFIKDIGLDSHLSPSRTNGLFSMVKQIKYYALAFQALTQRS